MIESVTRDHGIDFPDALISLHWLRVPERITFKVATLTYRALRGSAPPCLASSFTCVADMPHRRRLRFASTEQLDVPTCRRSTIGGRAFPVAGAKLCSFSSHYLPSTTVVFAMVFYCLGHFKIVYDDDDVGRIPYDLASATSSSERDSRRCIAA